jgi:hypothetical protein
MNRDHKILIEPNSIAMEVPTGYKGRNDSHFSLYLHHSLYLKFDNYCWMRAVEITSRSLVG